MSSFKIYFLFAYIFQNAQYYCAIYMLKIEFN